MSFTSGRDFIRSKLGMAPITKEEEKEKTAEELSKEEEEAIKNENSMLTILRYARKKYMDRGLIGEIEIYGSLTIFTSTVTCAISEESLHDDGNFDELETTSNSSGLPKLGPMERLVVSYLEGVLIALERRARPYRTLPFSDSVTLESGVYISEPLFGTVSISVTMAATVKSILNYIASKEAEAKAKEDQKHSLKKA